MAASVSCPNCNASFPVTEELLGKKMRCKGCQYVFVAMGAKVQVGAGNVGSESRPGARSGSNGVHLEPRVVDDEAEVAQGNKTIHYTVIGIGIALACMAAVTVWAVFLRTPSNDATGTQPIASNPGSVPSISITDTAKADTTAKDTEKPKEKGKVEAAKEKGKWVVGGFAEAPKNLPFQLAPDISQRAKRAAVFIKVVTEAGGGFGSGWFAEPGIVVTNSHVVGMKEPAAPPPKSVKLVIHQGTPEQRDFDGEILGLDRVNDLAVLRVKGENLPDPMPLAPSAALSEGQRLYVVGFPLGSNIAEMFSEGNMRVVTEAKARECTISGRFGTSHGSIKYVQIEGGADPGNSGSMIIDPAGYIRCVLVAGLGETNMRFTIPSEYAVYLLQGRMLRAVWSQAYQSGDKIRQPITTYVADPMRRLSSVALEVWTGERGKGVRPSSTSAPRPALNDANFQVVNFKYDANEPLPLGASHRLQTEFDLPTLPSGHAYWMRPKYVGADGKERWGEAVALETEGSVVQRKPATLAIRHQAAKEYAVELNSSLAVGATPEGGELHLRGMAFNAKMTEKVQSVTPEGMAKVQLKYKDFRFTDKDTDDQFRMVGGLLENIKALNGEFNVNKRGFIRNAKPVLNNVPTPIRPIMEGFFVQTIQSLEGLALALPDKEVQPGDTWRSDTNYTVQFSRLVETALFRINYRYVGSRIRDGREEAIVEYEGSVVKSDEQPPPRVASGKEKGKQAQLRSRGMHGVVRGSALVDLATGLVTTGWTNADMEFEVSFPGFGNAKFGGSYRMQLHRAVIANSKPPDVRKLLPNHEIPLDPFVGAPGVSLTQSPSPADRTSPDIARVP